LFVLFIYFNLVEGTFCGKFFIPFRTTEVPTMQKMKMCGPDEAQPWVIGDTMDCSGYFTCNGHFYIYQKCPEQLHFDPIRGICDHPHIVGCPLFNKI
jgi:hypothetical protein